MKQSLIDIQLLGIRLSIALLSYPICKIFFFTLNYSYFSDVSVIDFFRILFFGLRFDIAAMILVNAPFILLYILQSIPRPFPKMKGRIPFPSGKVRDGFLFAVFITVNSIAILADCLDLEYFKYTHKRTTADFFDLFSLGNDVPNLLPQYVKDFWYVVIIWVCLTVFIAWLYLNTRSTKHAMALRWKTDSVRSAKQTVGTEPVTLSGQGAKGNNAEKSDMPFFLFRAVSWLVLNSLLIFLFIIGFRGGLQLRPIMTITAAEYVSAKNIPLIINTPFSISRSFELEKLEEKNYFPEQELKSIFNPIHSKYIIRNQGSATNVFVIILESFSKEYIGSMSCQIKSDSVLCRRKKSYTPFLDSLINESLVFDNACANGKKSIEGIPAVLASIPALMNESYITSAYNSNQFTSIANTLKKKGYTSAFFHGGTNGTMGFDAFCNAAGFDHYFGRIEYNNDNDYDGDWGIWDENFFQYTEKSVSRLKKPFLAALFSLSSHHPYPVPEKYKRLFPEGKYPILKSVAYTDFALKLFFQSASKEKWFDNTLFVITADHTGPSADNFYSNSVGSFQIPIIFYMPNGALKGINHEVIQQTDIMPTVLNYLNYNEIFFSLGNNALDSAQTGYAVNFINDIYQIIQGDYILQFDGNKTIAFYNYKTDSLLQKNIMDKKTEQENRMETKLKAIIQTYNYVMIHDKMSEEHMP